MPPPSLVLVNPRAAGGRGAALVVPVQQWLQLHAAGATCVVAEDALAARKVIETQPRGTRVVLVGGDGTVHVALPALLERECTLALVPVGSGNDTARALGLASATWVDALALGLRAGAKPMDIGRCEVRSATTYFASSLTAGFDSAVGERARNGSAALRGLPRYLWATLRELLSLRTWPIRITLDGTAWHDSPALFTSVLNTVSYGGGMPAVPHALIDDGLLDLLVAGRFGRLGAAAMLPRLLAGRHLSHPRVMTRTFTRLQFESETAVPLAGDGEFAGSARAWQVSVAPGALQVVRRLG
jgi:diacylglycerol kinase family enzyme